MESISTLQEPGREHLQTSFLEQDSHGNQDTLRRGQSCPRAGDALPGGFGGAFGRVVFLWFLCVIIFRVEHDAGGERR